MNVNLFRRWNICKARSANKNPCQEIASKSVRSRSHFSDLFTPAVPPDVREKEKANGPFRSIREFSSATAASKQTRPRVKVPYLCQPVPRYIKRRNSIQRISDSSANNKLASCNYIVKYLALCIVISPVLKRNAEYLNC